MLRVYCDVTSHNLKTNYHLESSGDSLVKETQNPWKVSAMSSQSSRVDGFPKIILQFAIMKTNSSIHHVDKYDIQHLSFSPPQFPKHSKRNKSHN